MKDQTPDVSPAPHNIDAEQQLLGALLTNNNAFDRVSGLLTADHFYDPVHAQIFEHCAAKIALNETADPVTLKSVMEDHEGLKQLGGSAYLVRLAGASIASSSARDYAQLIYDLYVRRRMAQAGEDITLQAKTMDDGTSAEELLNKAEQSIYEIADKGSSRGGFKSFLSVATESVRSANAAYMSDRTVQGMPTGLKDLDLKLGGMQRSDLIILAGRPSMGKTALATNMAYNIAKKYKHGMLPDGTEGAVEGGVVGLFSLEMSGEQLGTRILSDKSEVASSEIRQGSISEFQFRRYIESAKELEAMPLYIDDTPALSISQLALRARRLKRMHGLDALFVDYLQLVRSASAYAGNRVDEISDVTQGLKAIAKELDIPVVALSQLSRQVESRDDKRPQLSDLRQSGSIEQDADVVLFVFREEYYVERRKPGDHDLEAMADWQAEMESVKGKAEVIIGKQRHGPIGTVELSFEGRFTRFGNLVKPWQQDADGDF